jgi:ATP-dependent Clp protease ATP-binding subunit ClpC
MAGLAEKLYLLETACGDLDADRPTRAFLELRVREKADGDASVAFFERLCAMYERWAKRRRMKLLPLATETLEDERVRLYAVAGFGAYTILAPEQGLHVLALPAEKKAKSRTRVRVRVVPQPPRAASSRKQWLALARQTLAEEPASGEIVRRYQEKPSPLVRDKVSGWKTGRLDRVLDGDFDLFRIAD